jgi:SAM-dependent methyltransferase
MTDAALPFRQVGRFLDEMLAAKLLGTALEIGLIDRLLATGLRAEEVANAFDLAPRGADLLLAGLTHGGVIEWRGEVAGLSPAFREALPWRDLLEAKLTFAGLVLPDIADLTLPLLGQGGEFMAKSRTFDLFRYDRAKHRTPENRAATKLWVDLLGTLTRYEAPGLLAELDLAGVSRALDVGGNCGELARAFAEAAPGIDAQVFDLPVVCDIGRVHLAKTAPGVTFIDGDLRGDALPGGQDLICFKSLLHDWPEADAIAFLTKAKAALAPGGRIVIFERAPFDFAAALPAYHDLPNLMFMHFLRPRDAYRRMLEALGLRVIQEGEVMLDMPFLLLIATA